MRVKFDDCILHLWFVHYSLSQFSPFRLKLNGVGWWHATKLIKYLKWKKKKCFFKIKTHASYFCGREPTLETNIKHQTEQWTMNSIQFSFELNSTQHSRFMISSTSFFQINKWTSFLFFYHFFFCLFARVQM